MKKKAFTLAEVLVTLGILGVIAALTLPSIMRLNEEAAIGSRLSKVQASLEEAVGRVMLDDPSVSIDKIENFEKRLSKHLVMKTATDGYDLKDGIQIKFGSSATGVVPKAAGSGYKDIWVDLNGKGVKPDVEGVDKFKFTLSSHGLMVAQGCAALIRDNNWKVPKGYDFSSCPSYSAGNDISGEGNEIGSGEEIQSQTKTCSDGSVVPMNATCKKKCPDGRYIDESASCSCTAASINYCVAIGGTLNSDCSCTPPGPASCSEEAKNNCTAQGRVYDDVNCICKPAQGGCTEQQKNSCLAQGGTLDSECNCQTPETPPPPACEPPEGNCGELGTFNSSTCECETTKKECPNGQIIGKDEPCTPLCPQGLYPSGSGCVPLKTAMDICNSSQFCNQAVLNTPSLAQIYLYDSSMYGELKQQYRYKMTDLVTGEVYEGFDEWFDDMYYRAFMSQTGGGMTSTVAAQAFYNIATTIETDYSAKIQELRTLDPGSNYGTYNQSGIN